ncbi:MAG: CheY-like chemotaxis protein [Cellvibrionaceae bacterium]|jgi:CheY-like chemotaxis protein
MAHILIVDDNPIMLRTLALIVKKTGHQTLVANSGLKAIEMIKSVPVSLAIVDMNMPGMNGLGLVEHIRLHETGSRLPIVFLTGSGRESDLKSAVELGIDEFLDKPVSSYELRDVIQQLLQDSVASDADA